MKKRTPAPLAPTTAPTTAPKKEKKPPAPMVSFRADAETLEALKKLEAEVKDAASFRNKRSLAIRRAILAEAGRVPGAPPVK